MSGSGRCFLLLHGLGATGAVWGRVEALLGERGAGRSLAPDLRGHGTARHGSDYSLDAIADDLVPSLAGEREIWLIGHSFGGYVALALASRRRALAVRGVLTVGSRVVFSDEDRAKAEELARRPARVFATSAEAVDRYRKVSGLDVTLAPDESLLARGTTAVPGGFRLAADPATLAARVPPFGALLAAASCPVLVARGEHDPLVSSAELKAVAPAAIDVPGVGHNLHVEAPATLVGLIDRMLAL